MNKYFYTWDEFNKDAEALAEKLKGNKYDSMLIITRGGLALGQILASRLGIRVIDTIGIQSYERGHKRGFEVTKKPNMMALKGKVLIVDDICDSGESLQYVVERYKGDTAVLFHSPLSRITPDYILKETGDWIVFPWEKQDETE